MARSTPAQPAVPVVTADTRVEDEPRRPLPVWSVESPGGRVSHVLGTFDLDVGLEEALPPPHHRALEEARVVLVETDLTRTDDVALARYAAASQLPPGQDLSAILGPDLWSLLLERVPMPEPMLRRLAPWFVMGLVPALAEPNRLEPERDGETSAVPDGRPSSLSTLVTERADTLRIPVVSLETDEEQVAMLSGLPLEEVVEYIRSALTWTRSEPPPIRERVDTYLRGDPAALERLACDPEEIALSPELFEAMVFERTERWLDALEAELARGGAFVAIHLAHVVGERGLLRLLEARGYRATRLVAP